MAQINAEFKRGLNLGAYRGVQHDIGRFPDSNISMALFYARQSVFSVNHQTTGTTAWDLYLFTLALGWDGLLPVHGVYTVGPGAVVRGTGNSPAMLVYGFPAESIITVYNYGHIIGQGGEGGTDGIGDGSGQSGNLALYSRSAMTLHNGGEIGGGGGGGAAATQAFLGASARGGGGAGFGGPNGGLGGGPGAATGIGAARGGNGGDMGLPGQGCFDVDGNGPYAGGGAPTPGAPGGAIDGSSFIQYAAAGSLRGAIV